ncbi:Ppx/GppA phosphatase family protein [Beijerinckia sp. L45]|uniref:Ppx/GppA phosphatase family protein n=1 Tax=Beijerinckia sp. L45 TaxID=1641855 RepID=UPI00131E4EBC|nr:Ppx/GppA phosphatase family protein [Beijerinckia sp. L45]
MPIDTHRPGVAPHGRPVAIVDIGSNSVRIVAYDMLDRAPVPMFNEKALCALGNGVLTTGKLAKQGIEKALVALRRFRVLSELMGITHLYVIATAAARDATNGAEFLDAARQALGGAQVTLLSGPREAELSALGVISGVYKPDGIVGDLGGGSLELIDIQNGLIGRGVSLPLGGLALMDMSGRSPKAAVKIARDAFAKCDTLSTLQGRAFYAVGGTWRALAKLHMGQQHYPMSVMHGYTLAAREASELVDLVERIDANALPAIETVSAARRPLLAYGAVVLDELIRRARPKEIIISTSGVREGLLFEALDAETRRQDALLVAAGKLNTLLSRSPAFADELIHWTAAFVASAGLDESDQDRRLREAACLLSEVNWRAHPDYRGVQNFNIVVSAQLPGVDHDGRAFLTLVTSLRHVGLDEADAPDSAAFLAPRLLERGRVLGAAMRVASLLAAGMPGVLSRTPMLCVKGKVTMILPPDLRDLMNDRLQSRVKQVGKTLGGREPVVAVAV